RVRPGTSATNASRVCVRRLNSVDLPTLGRPTRTRVGFIAIESDSQVPRAWSRDRDNIKRAALGNEGDAVALAYGLGHRRRSIRADAVRKVAVPAIEKMYVALDVNHRYVVAQYLGPPGTSRLE